MMILIILTKMILIIAIIAIYDCGNRHYGDYDCDKCHHGDRDNFPRGYCNSWSSPGW